MDKDEIRDIAQAVLKETRTVGTVMQYRRAWRMLQGASWRDYATAHGYAKSSAYRLKAAWQYGAAGEILRLLCVADQAQCAGGDALANQAHRDAAAYAQEIRTYADYERHHLLDGKQGVDQWENPRRGKRQSLRGLSAGWQRKLITAAADRDKLAIGVLALSGARPAELLKGIQVDVVGDGFRFTIRGAKTGQGHGQALRTFIIRNADTALLTKALDETNNELMVQIDDVDKDPLGAFRKRFASAARRAGMPGVSAYSLRHAFGSELKASGWPAETCAAVLGHSVDATQSRYGHACYATSGGSTRVEEVKTAQRIRNTAQPAPQLMNKPTLKP